MAAKFWHKIANHALFTVGPNWKQSVNQPMYKQTVALSQNGSLFRDRKKQISNTSRVWASTTQGEICDMQFPLFEALV